MERIIAVNSNCYHGYSAEEAIDGISAAGFHYIEMTSTRGWTEHVSPEMSLSRLFSLKERCREKGLQIIGMSGHCNLMDRERTADFIENMKLANFLGCRYIVSSIGEAHLQNNVVLSEEETAERLGELLPYLEKYQLQLVLEVHGKEHGTGESIKRILDKIPTPLIRVNYDTGNAVFYGNTDVEKDLEACVDCVAYMHLKDKAGAPDEWNFPALGKGNIPFRNIFGILEKHQNDCPVSIEIEFTQEGAENLEEVNCAVRDSYQYLKSIGMEMGGAVC